MTIIEQAAERLHGTAYRVVFTEGVDERILRAARALKDRDLCRPVLVGNLGEIAALAQRLLIGLDGLDLIDAADDEKQDEVARRYHEAAREYSEKLAKKKMKYPLFFAAMFVKAGYADCLAAGVTSSTADVILAAQQFIGLKPGIKTISSIGFQKAKRFDGGGEEQIIGLSDCAVCAMPTAEELASIAVTSAESYARVMRDIPRVALLSHSTLGSANNAAVELVREAVRLAHAMRPELFIEGEYQMDTALVPRIARLKVKAETEVAGRANVLIFPDLDAGNIAVKCMQLFGERDSYGPLLQGFSQPVTDFSRAATIADIVGNVALCLVLGEPPR